jgi:hypothetical protein
VFPCQLLIWRSASAKSWVPAATAVTIVERRSGALDPSSFRDRYQDGAARAGKIHAIEVRIFPEALRGIGEGQRPWDVKPDGVMTNATVGNVSQSPEGGVVRVTYKDGQSEFTVGPEVPVLAYVAGDRGLLKPGAAVLMIAQKKPDGTLTTGRVTAEKNSVKPPS